MCSEGDDPGGLAFGVASSVCSKAEIGCTVFIGDQLTVVPGGERFVTEDVSEIGEVFDQMFELFGVMAIPWCDGEPLNHTGVDVDTDVKFDAVSAFPLSFDADVVPGAAVLGAEPGAVHSDVHLFSSEKPGDSVHHLPNVGDGEPFHPSLDDTMSRDLSVVFFYDFAIFHVCFDTIVGLVESHFEKTTCCNGLWIVSFPSFFIGFPGWWHTVNRFDHRLGEVGDEVAVHMVRYCWVYPFLCPSHPMRRKVLLLP